MFDFGEFALADFRDQADVTFDFVDEAVGTDEVFEAQICVAELDPGLICVFVGFNIIDDLVSLLHAIANLAIL